MKQLILLFVLSASLASTARSEEPGWHISPLPREGDRASLGCSRDSTDTDFACLAVRCEDDFTVGVHVHTSRMNGDAGRWTMTLDREARTFDTIDATSPYGARLENEDGFLLDRIRQGTFIYLRHAEDEHAPFRYISLDGSFQAIEEALYWCAPRLPAGEQNEATGVVPSNNMEMRNEPPPARTQ